MWRKKTIKNWLFEAKGKAVGGAGSGASAPPSKPTPKRPITASDEAGKTMMTLNQYPNLIKKFIWALYSVAWVKMRVCSIDLLEHLFAVPNIQKKILEQVEFSLNLVPDTVSGPKVCAERASKSERWSERDRQ